MDMQTLANLGEFIGGIGVIFSLIYLAVQVRSNTNSQRADITARTLERLGAMQYQLAKDSDFTKMHMRGLAAPASLDATQRVQFTWIMTEMFSSWEYMFYQAEQGNLDQQIWQRWEETIKWWLTFPGTIAFWRGKPTPYGTDYSEFIERSIRDGYHPESPGAWEAFLSTGNPRTVTETVES